VDDRVDDRPRPATKPGDAGPAAQLSRLPAISQGGCHPHFHHPLDHPPAVNDRIFLDPFPPLSAARPQRNSGKHFRF
jgi:hypothetical protein